MDLDFYYDYFVVDKNGMFLLIDKIDDMRGTLNAIIQWTIK